MLFFVLLGLIRLQELLKAPSEYNVAVTVRRLEPTLKSDYRPILKEVKKRGESRIILDCEYDLVHDILKQVGIQINTLIDYTS